METSHSPLPRSSVQSWGAARLCLFWDTSSSESLMARSGLKSSGVRGRNVSSGGAPECLVQGALVTTVELLRLFVQVRCRSGLTSLHTLFRWESHVILLKLCLLLPAYSEVRLMTNGSSQCEGQVEMKISGRWRALCASHWSLANANVVCRQLGCGVAISTPRGPHLVEGGDQISTAQFHCSGAESFLWSCPVTALGGPDCSHGNTASVICSGKRGKGYYT